MTAVANTLAQSIPMMATSTSLSTTCTVGGRGSPFTAHKLSIRYVDLAGLFSSDCSYRDQILVNSFGAGA